jgi:iron(III) transport system permease protein
MISAMVAVPVVRFILKNRGFFAQVIERLSFTGYALPGIVVALALVFFGANLAEFMYQTFWLLIFAYLVLFFPVALGTIRSAGLQISPFIEESSRSLGRTAIETLWIVTLPLLRRSVLAGAVLVFLVTMKELPATLILGPMGFKTLSTVVWSASSEAFFAQAAVPALLLIMLSSIPMAFLMSRDVRVNW